MPSRVDFSGPLFDDPDLGQAVEQAFLRNMHSLVEGPIRERLRPHLPKRTGRLRRSFTASRGRRETGLGFRDAPYWRYQRRPLRTITRIWRGEVARNVGPAYQAAVQEVTNA